MNDKIYYNPINGKELQVDSDGILHSPSHNMSFTATTSGELISLKSPIDASKLHMVKGGLFESDYNSVIHMISDGKIIPLLSPINHAALVKDADGLYSSKYDNIRYIVSDTGTIKPLIDPFHHTALVKDADGLYSSRYDNIRYIVSDTGAIKPLIDPFSGGSLTQNADGTYQSLSTGKPFIYDSIKDSLIPLYVPDDSGELGHIEGEMLVGNETGRRFEIDHDGTILTPQELAFREIKQKETERFNQMEQDGTIEDYLNDIKEKMKNQKPLSVDDMRQILNNELPDDVDELKQVRDQIYQQTTPIIVTQSTMAIQEFLNLNNIQNENDFTNYLRTIGVDGRIIDYLGMTHGTNFMSLLGQDMNAQISIIGKNNGDKILYIPTTQNSQTASTIEILQGGNLKVIDNNHTPVMVDGIRYGTVNIIDMKMNENGSLNMVESHHEVMPHDGFAPVDSKPRFIVTSSQRPLTINPNGEITQDMGINRQSILEAQDGVLKPIQQNETLEEKLQQLRDMGLDERYFTKPNIAGINYDINGEETMFESENLKQIPEIGINEIPFSKLINPDDEYRENRFR
jgi:hypothetical protein